MENHGHPDGDVERVVTRAMVEAHGENPFKLTDIGYPVPKYMDHDDCRKVVRACLEQQPCALEVAERARQVERALPLALARLRHLRRGARAQQ